MVSKPLALTDEQMSAVMNAAAPLRPLDRGRFLQALADALRNEPQPLGDDTVAKAIRHVIRPYFRPPPTEREAVHHRRNIGPPLP
jgi:hypothetical protein